MGKALLCRDDPLQTILAGAEKVKQKLGAIPGAIAAKARSGLASGIARRRRDRAFS
jgi:hypothetical protein